MKTELKKDDLEQKHIGVLKGLFKKDEFSYKGKLLKCKTKYLHVELILSEKKEDDLLGYNINRYFTALKDGVEISGVVHPGRHVEVHKNNISNINNIANDELKILEKEFSDDLIDKYRSF